MISSSQSHSLNHSVSALSLTVSHGHKPTSSQAQAVLRRSHTVATLSQAYSSLLSQVSTPFGLTVADLTVAQPSSVFPSHLPRPWPHGLAPLRSPSFSSSFFFFFFWVQFVSNSQYEFVFVIAILKGKIIDPKFVFRISVFMFVIVFGFVLVFVILGRKIID